MSRHLEERCTGFRSIDRRVQDKWCRQNCLMGNCPADFCACIPETTCSGTTDCPCQSEADCDSLHHCRTVVEDDSAGLCSETKKCTPKVGQSSQCGVYTLGTFEEFSTNTLSPTLACQQAQCQDELTCADGTCQWCPWLKPWVFPPDHWRNMMMEGWTDDGWNMKCTSGDTCNVKTDPAGWGCCKQGDISFGGRRQCPANFPTMCANKDCGGGDYCCSHDECKSTEKRVCSILDGQCQENATAKTCSTSCEPTCDDPSGKDTCDQECVPGALEHECRCEDELIRKTPGGPCVLPSDC